MAKRHKHKKVYMEYFGYCPDDIVMCENSNCHAIAADIHHILFRSQGGTDEIHNLIALCTECHETAHGRVPGCTLTREHLFDIVASRNG